MNNVVDSNMSVDNLSNSFEINSSSFSSKYIKIDNFPQNDFETNCRYDAFGNSVDGKEVFINPEDLSEIYVATLYYWREGSYTIYTKCVICE